MWHRFQKFRKEDGMGTTIDYWDQELADIPSHFELIIDSKKSLNNWVSNVSSKSRILEEKEKLIYNYCERFDLNINEVFLSAYYILLYRMSDEKDIIVGVNGESNLLPVRIKINSNLNFHQFIIEVASKLKQVKDSASIYSVKYLRDSNIYSSFNADKTIFCTKMDWFVSIDKYIMVDINYNESFVNSRSMYKLVRHYEKLLVELLSNPTTAIGDVEILLEDDKQTYQIMNNTETDIDNFKTIIDMFNHTVRNYPLDLALSADGIQYTYKELDIQINKVANTLIKQNIRKGDFVSILMGRSVETVVSLMAVMKIGAIYVPLDPKHPKDRNLYIISDSHSNYVITTYEYATLVKDMFKNGTQQVLYYEDCTNTNPTDIEYIGNPDNVAYVIYTSGSTGKPKGTLIRHKGLMNLCPSIRDTFNLSSSDILLQFASFSFDASIYEMFGAFYCGAHLHLINDEERISIEAFANIVDRMSITCIPLIPTIFFNQLATHLSDSGVAKFKSVRTISTGGEALTSEIAKSFMNRFGPDLRVVNLYGPTECTAVTSSYEVRTDTIKGLSIVPIGRPYKNYEMYIVNEHSQPCPLYVPGEILIKSVGVANGYLNQPEKTREAFIDDPFDPSSDKRFYKTGDIGRLLPGGNIEYISRKDSQIKIRGFRVEIGEIEDSISRHEKVQDIAVIVKSNGNKGKVLIAYYTTTNKIPISVSKLKEFLSDSIPQYMIPHHICFLKEIPISPTGKIDRKVLNSFDFHDYLEDNKDMVAPTTSIEKKVWRAWRNGLDIEDISITDHFFEIGGDSLSIMQILVILKPDFPNIKISDFYQYPTIQELSNRIEETRNGEILLDQYDNNKEIRHLIPYPETLQGEDISLEGVSTTQDILLTGATGYLGSHILYNFLKNSSARLYCLLRDGDKSRLTSVLNSYFDDITNHDIQRIQVIKGDLSKPRLALNESEYAYLRRIINNVVHCGAEVKHHGDHEHFNKANVMSTVMLLDLIQLSPNVQFHYISTLGIPEDLALSGRYNIFPFDPTIVLENVYTNSKLKSEIQVNMRSNNIPSAIYRMGNLVGNSINGKFQVNINNNAFYRMLKAMMLLGKAPKANWYVDLTPIDYASKYIVRSIEKGESINKLLHVCNPIHITYNQMVEYLVDYGYNIQLLEKEEYSRWLFNEEEKDQEGLQLAMAQLEGDGAKDSNYKFISSESNIDCHEPNREFFYKLINYAVSIGYFPEV
ncbi:amino acid adenylation domain-containing protein [Chengkuizengella sp. SCS-71B]|uniref:amino acid adenylation domain-containing protein n=1 Tax=Chengkuizengella sp. SCS-71B TaxID=3115290 RepID=UPI0032C2381B